MQPEIEVKFLNVNHDAIRERLRELGAELEQPMRLMRRALFDHDDGRLNELSTSQLRVRDEGHRATITFKTRVAPGAEGVKEIETTVGDYNTAVALLEAAGLHVRSRQESKRETWHYGDSEVVLDEWPWLKPYIEIEGPSEPRIREIAEQLGFNWDDAVFGSVTEAYRAEYDFNKDQAIGKNTVIAFDMPVPEWMEKIKK
ncbi:MAG TPA: class IV adenylate cyclase [Candidatus Saccharimonadales bacterium]